MNRLKSLLVVSVLALTMPLTFVRADESAPKPQFEKHIRPILKAHCWHCHGEDGPDAMSELRTCGRCFDGRPNRWHESGIEAARLSESQWLRSVADMSAGCYVPFVAAAKLPEPEWPADLKMSDLLRLAFQGRFIRDTSHPCLQRLRGEI